MVKNKKPEKRDTDCQTILQCTPHFLNEDEVAVVQSEATCQTEITSEPQKSNTELYDLLRFVEPELISGGSVREIDIPRKTRLHFKVPEVENNDISINEDAESVPKLSLSNESVNGEVGRRRKSSSSTNSESKNKYFENGDQIFDTIPAGSSVTTDKSIISSILKKTSNSKSKHENKSENECQTNLMVAPHILEVDENAIVSSNLSVQTSVTCSPACSTSEIISKLESYVVHEGETTVKATGGLSGNISVLDFIKDLIHEVENKHERIFQYQKQSSNISAIIANSKSDSIVPANMESQKHDNSDNAKTSLPNLANLDNEDTEDLDCACDFDNKNENEETSTLQSKPTYDSIISESRSVIIESVVNEIFDKATREQTSRSNVVIEQKSSITIQNLITDIINSATKTKTVEYDQKSLMESYAPENITTSNACSCKMPNIKINIFMNNVATANLDLHATASVAYGESQASIKDKAINVRSFLPQDFDTDLKYPEMQRKQTCNCTSVAVKTNKSPEGFRPEISVNIINNASQESSRNVVNNAGCQRNITYQLGGNNEANVHNCADTYDFLNKNDRKCNKICKCSSFSKTLQLSGDKIMISQSQSIKKTDEYFQKRILENENQNFCADFQESTNEQGIKTDEHVALACKCRNLNNILIKSNSNIVESSKLLAVTNLSIKSQRNDSVLGCNEDNINAGIQKFSPCNVSQAEHITSNTAYILATNIYETIMNPKQTATISKSVKDVACTSKPIEKITIGIGPIKPDPGQPGCIAIPLKVILKRESFHAPETEATETSSRHPSFTYEKEKTCFEPYMQELKAVPESSTTNEDVVTDQEMVYTLTSTYVEPYATKGYLKETDKPQHVVNFEAETLIHSIPLSDEPQEKCTVNTCAHITASKPHFAIPWNDIELPPLDKIEIATVHKEPPLPEEQPRESEVEKKDSDKATCFGCCPKGKTEAPYEPIQQPPEPEPEPESEPEPVKISLVFDQRPCSLNEPYITSLLRETDSNQSYISTSSGVSWADIILPTNIKIKKIDRYNIEEIPSFEPLGQDFEEHDEEGISSCPCPSKLNVPGRIQKKINLKDSKRYMDNQKKIENCDINPVVTSVKKSNTNMPHSIYTLYPSASFLYTSTTFHQVMDKPSIFIAVVNFLDDPASIRISKSESRYMDTPAICQDERKVNFEQSHTCPFTATDKTNQFEVEATLQPVQTTENICKSCNMIYSAKSKVALSESIEEISDTTSGQVLFSHTIILTDEFNLAFPDTGKVREQCKMHSYPEAERTTMPLLSTVTKESVCCINKEETTASLYQKTLNMKFDKAEDICEPCKMKLPVISTSSTNIKEDPVMLALVACERELKPVKEGLNKVRLKLQNLNMPELDCLFNKENDIYSFSRTNNRPLYGDTTSSAKYNYPYSRTTNRSPFHSDQYSTSSGIYQNNQNPYYLNDAYQREQPENNLNLNKGNVRFRMKFNTNNNEVNTISRKAKIRFQEDEIPCKYNASVSTLHRNPYTFDYSNTNKSERDYGEQFEKCASNATLSSDEWCNCTCSKRRQTSKKPSKCSDKGAPSRASIADAPCPFLEALKAILFILDSNNKKKTSKTKHITVRKSQLINNSEKIRLRFKIKPNQFRNKKK